MKIIIKDRCVLCNRKLESYLDERCITRYWEYGNICPECTAICNRSGRVGEEETFRQLARRVRLVKVTPRSIEIEVPEHNVFNKLPEAQLVA